MTNLEFKTMLEKRTTDFSVAVLGLFPHLPKGPEFANIKDQLNRSATSVGANYREANKAESTADFCHKFAIASKEMSEAEYWLNILARLAPQVPGIDNVWHEANELMRLFAKAQATQQRKR